MEKKNMTNKEKCFFCNSEAEVGQNPDKLGRDFICPVCGKYFMTGFSSEHYEQLMNRTKYTEQKALLRYYLKRNTINKSQFDWFEATPIWVANILRKKTLPNIIEQTENLILYCGNKFKQGESFERNIEMVSVVGSQNIEALDIIIKSLVEKKTINKNRN